MAQLFYRQLLGLFYLGQTHIFLASLIMVLLIPNENMAVYWMDFCDKHIKRSIFLNVLEDCQCPLCKEPLHYIALLFDLFTLTFSALILIVLKCLMLFL